MTPSSLRGATHLSLSEPHTVACQGAIPVLRSVAVVPATRRVRGIPTEVTLDEADGTPEACALSFDNVVTMPRASLVERLAFRRRVQVVCRALAVATGCT